MRIAAYLVLVASIPCLLIACEDPKGSGTPSDADLAKHIYELSGDSATAAARNFVIGTWTYTGQEFSGQWIKWTIKDDGMMECYEAAPVNDNWGKVHTAKWKIISEKYADTGKRYYALSFKGDDESSKALITEEGDLRHAGELFKMERGDKFPFSK